MAYKPFKRSFRKKRMPAKRRTYGKRKTFTQSRRPRYYRRKALTSVKVKCNGQIQPYAKYIQKAPYWKSKLERLYFNASKNAYRQLATFSVEATNGAQGVAQQFIWSASDINAMLNTITGLGPGTSGQVKNTNRIYLQSCDVNYTMTNSSNSPIEFDIYVFDTKNDAEDALITTWETGLQDMIGTALPDTNSVQYGITPLNNPAVSQYYKCIRIFHYVVNPGQMFKYQHFNNLYRLYNNERNNPDLQTDAYFRGIAQTILFVVKGAPAPQSVNATLTSTAPCAVDIVVTKEYRFKYIEDRNYNMNDTTDLTNTAVKVYNMSGYGTTETTTGAVVS